MNKRHYEHTLPNIRGSLSNTYTLFTVPIYKGKAKRCADITQPLHLIPVSYIYEHLSEAMYMPYLI